MNTLLNTQRPAVRLSTGRLGFRALFAAEVKILSEKDGLAEYVASDETCDCFKEIVRADGWRFSMFAKNAPFVDSHNYHTIENLLGAVVGWKVDQANRRLVETVQWAKDVPENKLAQIGWAMTQAGFLKAVSVGFDPVNCISKYEADQPDKKPIWDAQLKDLGIDLAAAPNRIFIEQEQIELSACILGANPNALQLAARAYKSGAIGDAQIEFLSQHLSREPASAAIDPAVAAQASRLARELWLRKFNQHVEQIKV